MVLDKRWLIWIKTCPWLGSGSAGGTRRASPGEAGHDLCSLPPHDGLERELKCCNGLEGGVCTMQFRRKRRLPSALQRPLQKQQSDRWESMRAGRKKPHRRKQTEAHPLAAFRSIQK